MENSNIENIYKEGTKENLKERFTKAFVESIQLSEKSKQKDTFHLQNIRHNL